MTILKKITLIILLISCIAFTSCKSSCKKEKDPTTDPGNVDVPPVDNPNTINGYTYDGVKTVGPYKVYSPEGAVLLTEQSMTRAIRYASANSSSSKKLVVKDANDLEIFKREAKTKAWCYEGSFFVGLKTKQEALDWSKTKTRSYVVDGMGQTYLTIGTDYYPGSDLSQDINLELNAGAYNYMYSKSGYLVSDVWEKQGYGYASFIVRLSEAHYMPTQDGDGWNAYIFINGAGGYNSDLGLIGNLEPSSNTVNWRLVRNCSYKAHDEDEATHGPHFTTLIDGKVQSVTRSIYNPETKDYTGADDLLFECYQHLNGWNLTITNLRTNEEFKIDEVHEGMYESSSSGYLRFLLAASYCPVVENVWNTRCGAYLTNVVFDNIKIARWNEEGIYNDEDLEDFYPGESCVNYGFSQGGDCASYSYGVRESDGTYASGNTYKKGDKYLIYNTFYDGRLEK